MARSKARVYTCCALILLILVAIIVCIAVLVRRKCPDDTFSRAAVAADSQKCSEIGRDILKQGGSAVDGAIAALLCTSIMNPQSMGVGGGSIFTVMSSSGEVKIINSREIAPQAVNPNLLKSCAAAIQITPDAQWIGIPGEIRGYEKAHKLYGKLPWAKLFQPTIQMAREGFPVPQIQGRYIPFVNDSKALRKIFSDENGNLLKIGDIVKFEKLADTLEIIANQGADAFYNGTIAKDLIHDIQEAGGTLTLQDLASYKATVSDAWAFPLGEYQMYIPPPPAGGIILSLVLNIMKGYNLNSASATGEEKTLTYHRYIEAFKFVNGLKKHIRDPNFSSEKFPQKKLMEDNFANLIRKMISSEKTHDAQYYNITPHLDSIGTTHVSVLAEDGSAVSATSSINYIFGSKVFSPRTGVILNNQLSDFCWRVDNIYPGEQPPSSMSPAVLKSQTKTLVIGSTGGSMITTGIASTLMNHLWFGKSLKEAIAAPVVFVNSTNAVRFESHFDKNVIQALKNMGHDLDTAGRFFNVVQAVEKEDGCICAVSDARKLGKAAGY
ncbi:gamma-glutamyltransferase 5a isoform X1 [Sphaeramia orbicularis]|uniref:gamma-glutamyltransferase 5a isoform X1 n=1 Tax=Sphaeramia orbicularis TaxID=375764 RepID=UPI00117BFD45|nr:glutathione hydrolase 5 proenzyme-like isoform X1 [Sphaeramia orbicularis]